MGRRGKIRRSTIALAVCPVLVSGCIFGLPFVGGLPAPSPSPAGGPLPSAPNGPILPSPTALASLPDLPIVAIPDGPALAIWTPQPGARIRIAAWRDGRITELIVVPLLNHDPTYLDHVRVSMAPTGRFLAVVEAADGPSISRAFVRIFSVAGDLVWTGPENVTANPTIRWSPDGSRVVIDARSRWLVVTPAPATGTGTGTGTASVTEIDSRRAVATGEGDYPWELLDFSEDGETLFGSRSAGLVPGTYPLATVPARGGALRPIAALPTAKGRRLAPLLQLGDARLEAPIDPSTGRIALATGGTGGGLAIEVRSGETAAAFPIPGGATGPVDYAWQRGSLVMLHDGPDPASQRLGIVSTGKDLGAERAVMSVPVVGQHARLVAITDGFAVLAFGRGFGEVPNRLLLVRLQDGRMTLVDEDGDASTAETFGFAGWLPLAGPALASARR